MNFEICAQPFTKSSLEFQVVAHLARSTDLRGSYGGLRGVLGDKCLPEAGLKARAAPLQRSWREGFINFWNSLNPLLSYSRKVLFVLCISSKAGFKSRATRSKPMYSTGAHLAVLSHRWSSGGRIPTLPQWPSVLVVVRPWSTSFQQFYSGHFCLWMGHPWSTPFQHFYSDHLCLWKGHS